MTQVLTKAVEMDSLRRCIVQRLNEGYSLHSPEVVCLSQDLDRLVMHAYRSVPVLAALPVAPASSNRIPD